MCSPVPRKSAMQSWLRTHPKLIATLSRPVRLSSCCLVWLMVLGCEPRSVAMAPVQPPPALAPAVRSEVTPEKVVNELQLVERSSAVLPGDWNVDFRRPCLTTTGDGAYSVALPGSLDVPGSSLFVRYDGYLARPAPPSAEKEQTDAVRELPLQSLLDEWGTLTAGKHRLVVFAADHADGRTPETAAGDPALSICDVEVTDGQPADVPQSDVAAQPRVVLLSPEGTFNGDEAADSAHLQLFVVPRARAATLVVERPDGGQDRHQLEAGTYAIEGLQSGDYQFSAGFVAADGFASGGLWTPHVITVNRDAK